MLKKIFSILLSLCLFTALCTTILAVDKEEFNINSEVWDEPLVLQDDEFLYDGETEILIGEYTEKVNPLAKGYYEYYRYTVYDQGITNSWVYLSNPYFIMSIAKGMTYTTSKSVTSTISASYGSGIPSEALSKVNAKFGINASGSKTVTQSISLSGPSGNFTSRDFYYQQGRHRHSIKIVKELVGSQGMGVIRSSTSYSTVDKPAIKIYSLDRY